MKMTLKRARPDGSPMFAPPHKGLSQDRVRYVGDPVAVVIAETLAQAKDAAEGVAILLVEQNVTKALEIASRVYVLEEGRTVASGTPAELLAQTSIQDAYLGR